jgi:hypothetical protein
LHLQHRVFYDAHVPPVKIQNGPVLSRDAGQVTIIRTFDATTLLDQVVVGEKGPHPDLDSGFEVFCDVLVPALT